MRWFSLLLILSACSERVVVQDLGEDAQITTVTIDYANVHVLSQGGRHVLFDAGLERNAEILSTILERQGIWLDDLAAVVLTHGHADHAGGANYFRDLWATPIVVGAGDATMLRTGVNEPLCPTSDFAENRVDIDQAETYAPYSPDLLVSEPVLLADLLGIPGLPGEILPVPGHTEGSIVADLGEGLIVGDLLRGSITGRAARRHFYQCDEADNQADIEGLLESTTAETWFPGHFGPLTRDAVAKLK